MTDYISREAAIETIRKVSVGLINQTTGAWDLGFTNALCLACNSIAALPAADVRPVVLCKDCKYSYDSVGGWCCSHGICVDCVVREDFFCADGEKREKS